ncbi:MAG: hypothetical protein ACYCT1_08110 [Steroidobacteraceae bacterium]
MTWLRRWRRRRRLLREAEAMEAEAHRLRKSLPQLVGEAVHPVAGAALFIGLLALAANRPDWRPVVAEIVGTRQAVRVSELEAEARAKREEAARWGARS